MASDTFLSLGGPWGCVCPCGCMVGCGCAPAAEDAAGEAGEARAQFIGASVGGGPFDCREWKKTSNRWLLGVQVGSDDILEITRRRRVGGGERHYRPAPSSSYATLISSLLANWYNKVTMCKPNLNASLQLSCLEKAAVISGGGDFQAATGGESQAWAHFTGDSEGFAYLRGREKKGHGASSLKKAPPPDPALPTLQIDTSGVSEQRAGTPVLYPPN